MAAQFGRAPLASPPVLSLVIGAADARTLLWAPCNVRSNRTLRRSSVGAQVLSPSFVGIMCSFAMVDYTASAARLFAADCGNLLEILDVQKWRPPPDGTGQGAVNNGSAEELWRYRLNKTGPSRPQQGRQLGQAWLHAHVCAPPGSEQTAYLVPAGGSRRPPPYTHQRDNSAVPLHSGSTSDTSVDLLIRWGEISHCSSPSTPLSTP